MTLYNGLKVFHILCATLFLMGMIASARAWLFASDVTLLRAKLNTRTLHLIVPIAFLQLLSGFTMISLQHDSMSEYWIKTSLMGFMVLIVSWFGFLFSRHKKLQRIFLVLCFLAIGIMIFMMANKV